MARRKQKPPSTIYDYEDLLGLGSQINDLSAKLSTNIASDPQPVATAALPAPSPLIIPATPRIQVVDHIDESAIDPASDSDEPFQFQPVSVEEFIYSSEYYGDEVFEAKHGHKEIWPWIYEDLSEIFSGPDHSPKYNTVVILTGIGGGKSSLTGLAFSYMTYWLHCLRSPASYFNLIRDSTMAFVNLAPTATTAKKVVFDKVQKTISKIPFFKKHGWEPDPRIQSELVFKKKSINIVPGNSSQTFTLGYDFYGGVIDESCFFVTASHDPVEDLYDNLNRRRFSRFKDKGVIIMISSAGSENTFVERYAEEHKGDPAFLFRRRSMYDCDPYYKDKPRFQLTVTRELSDGTTEAIKLNPPEELRADYEENQSKALRDLDAIPSHTMDPFYLPGDWLKVLHHLNRDREDPFPDLGYNIHKRLEPVSPQQVMAGLPDWFQGEPGCHYYCHADLSKGDSAKKHCPAGFAMVHKEQDVDTGNVKMVLDLSVRFVAEPGTTLNPRDVRALVYYLHGQRGFEIRSCTFDTYQSQESILELKEKNYFSEHLAVGYEQHTMTKNLATTGGIDMYYDVELCRELKSMEDKVKTVESALGMFKDEADALAGAIWGAYTAVDDGFHPKKKRAKRGRVVRGGGAVRGGGVPGMGLPHQGGWRPPRYRGQH